MLILMSNARLSIKDFSKIKGSIRPLSGPMRLARANAFGEGATAFATACRHAFETTDRTYFYEVKEEARSDLLKFRLVYDGMLRVVEVDTLAMQRALLFAEFITTPGGQFAEVPEIRGRKGLAEYVEQYFSTQSDKWKSEHIDFLVKSELDRIEFIKRQNAALEKNMREAGVDIEQATPDLMKMHTELLTQVENDSKVKHLFNRVGAVTTQTAILALYRAIHPTK